MHLDIRSWEGPNEEAIWGHFAPGMLCMVHSLWIIFKQ